MRLALAVLTFGLFSAAALPSTAQTAPPTSCTGLCLQQTTCPTGTTTSVSGVVKAPNDVDPLPNVLIYVPNGTPDAFTPGVSCPVVGAPPTGDPLVGTMSNVDGTFTIANMPVGTNIPIVIQSGRWRRQLTIPTTTACVNTTFNTRFPRNQSEGDIPKFAIATGSADSVECVLRKVGVDDAEFTNPSGTGRFNLYRGSGSAGAQIDASTPSQTALMSNASTLNSYDVLMLPCEGNAFNEPAGSLQNFVGFANAGGRVYSSHYAYEWMSQNPPFDTVVNWSTNNGQLPNGIAYVDPAFGQGKTLSDWLQLTGASSSYGQIAVSTIRHDFNNVRPPTQSWLRLGSATSGNVMQFTFDAPIGAPNQCGKVLFNEYHVENPILPSAGVAFPRECPPLSMPMTPQEKLLEFSLFELTNDGGAASLTPLTADFGTEPVGFQSNAQTFTWKNNSFFTATVGSVLTTGDFVVAANGCGSVAPNGSCQINVAFAPKTLGPATGTLTVTSSASSLTAQLSGTGVPGLSLAPAAQDFGNVDVGATASQNFVLTNNAPGTIPLPPLVLTGDYSARTACQNPVPANSTCPITVTFAPTTSGPRPGTLMLSSTTQLSAALTGNGLDFTLVLNPTSGTVIAGYGASTSATVSPLAGFAGTIRLTCTTSAPGSVCTPAISPFADSSPVKVPITITTTAKYNVIGYGGAGGSWLLALLAAGSGLLLLSRRRLAPGFAHFAQAGAVLLMLLTVGLFATGCSGKLPDVNSNFTGPGDYTYTVTATDGTITHSATYSLHVTPK